MIALLIGVVGIGIVVLVTGLGIIRRPW